jgi:hypothetical protein
MSGKTNRVKAVLEDLASTMPIVIIAGAPIPIPTDRNALRIVEMVMNIKGVPMTADPNALERAEMIMAIAATGNILTTEAAITGTICTIGIGMNTEAIGVHGTNGTGMREGIPMYIDMDIITGMMPI